MTDPPVDLNSFMDDDTPDRGAYELAAVLGEAQPVSDADIEEDPSTVNDRLFGTFLIGERELALPAELVREVVPYPDQVTAVPLCAPAVEGIFSLRGEVLAIVDAAELLSLESKVRDEERRVAVVASGDSFLGVVFDATGEVVSIPPDHQVPMQHSNTDGEQIVDSVLQLDGKQRLVQVLCPEALGALPGVPSNTSLARDSAQANRVYSKGIVARVGHYDIAFRIEDVVEISEELELESTQATVDHGRGLVSLRGELRAIMDFRSVLQLEPQEAQKKLLFLSHDGESVGLEVDALIETYEFPEDEVMELPQLPSSTVGEIHNGVVLGSDGRHILIADTAALFERYEIVKHVCRLNMGDVAEKADDGLDIEDESFLSFKIGGAPLSLPLEQVDEVCEFPDDLIRTDRGSGALCGIMNLRGEMIPLTRIDMSGPGKSDPNATEAKGAVVIAEVQGARRGLVVDSIESIVRGRVSRTPSDALFRGDDRSLVGFSDCAALVECSDGTSVVLVVLDPNQLLGIPEDAPNQAAA